MKKLLGLSLVGLILVGCQTPETGNESEPETEVTENTELKEDENTVVNEQNEEVETTYVNDDLTTSAFNIVAEGENYKLEENPIIKSVTETPDHVEITIYDNEHYFTYIVNTEDGSYELVPDPERDESLAIKEKIDSGEIEIRETLGPDGEPLTDDELEELDNK